MKSAFSALLFISLILAFGSHSNADYITFADLNSNTNQTTFFNDALTIQLSTSAIDFFDNSTLQPSGRGPFIGASPSSIADFIGLNLDQTIDLTFNTPVVAPAIHISGMDNSQLIFDTDIQIVNPTSNFGTGTASVINGNTLQITGDGWDGSVLVLGPVTSLQMTLQGETTEMGMAFAINSIPEPSAFFVLGFTATICRVRRRRTSH